MWRELSACKGEDTATWFSPSDPAACARAKAICDACPVNVQCRTDALSCEAGLPLAHRFGIRAGLDPAARAQAARDRQASK